jgi:uncharacterized membrane protein
MNKILLDLHVLGGAAALLSMLVPLLARKGARLHRRSGWLFVAGMTLVCVSALVLSVIGFFTDETPAARRFSMLLIYIALLTGAGMWAGLRVLRAKHRQTRGPAIDVGMAALLAGSGGFMTIVGLTAREPLLVILSLIGLVNGAFQVWYWLRPPAVHMHWWLTHMGSMLGTCIVAATAVTIAGGRAFGLPGDSLIAWLGPTAVGLPLIAVWTTYYHRRFSASRPGRASAMR